MPEPRFTRYIALGDSMSIDLYPALHFAGVASESQAASLRRGLGAASLLHRNDDELWPGFAGRDLSTLVPDLAYRNGHDLSAPTRAALTDNFATDGATTSHVLAYQLPRLEPGDEPTLVTITAGGNDLLEHVGTAHAPRTLVHEIETRMRRIVARVLEKRPHALVVLGTIYDPSDGTNDLGWGRLDREAAWLASLNDALRAVAAATTEVRLADIHRHFLGHGLTASPAERWYWPHLVIEPGLRGASEIRRLWLEAAGF